MLIGDKRAPILSHKTSMFGDNRAHVLSLKHVQETTEPMFSVQNMPIYRRQQSSSSHFKYACLGLKRRAAIL